MYKKFLVLTSVVLLFSFSISSASAATQPAVLGATSSQFTMPPTIEGPGLITPDSPLYFLDLAKQQIRLFFSFGALAKANTYNAIANERFAEFRVEVLRNNRNAAFTALQGLKDNTFNAAQELSQAQSMGQNVSQTASVINQDIARHQEALDELATQSVGELLAQITVAQGTLSDAKNSVENGLNPGDLANAIQQDLSRQAISFANTTVDSATQLEQILAVLQQQASQAASANQQKREVALQQAIKQNNAALQQVAQGKVSLSQQRSALSQTLQQQAAAEAQDIVQKAQEVAQTVKTSQEVVNADQTNKTTVLGISQSLTPTPTKK